jgi:hypothetical protein
LTHSFDLAFFKKVNRNCKCQVRIFDKDQIYSKLLPHLLQLKTYAWKPLIVQDALNSEDLVLYIDSSIKFNNKKLQPTLSSAIYSGLALQTLPAFNLTCYTDKKMFNWFQETPEDFFHVPSLEANIIFFKRSVVTSLVMKAWVTCALDKECIAPAGKNSSFLYSNLEWVKHGLNT